MRYRFGHCELRTDSRELVVDGAIRSVEPQVFDLLCLLASRAGHVVSHDELMEIVWGGRIVSDSAVSARISAARVAVDDDGTTRRYGQLTAAGLRLIPFSTFHALALRLRGVPGHPHPA
jgi:DNA-binding winged helix-turn-helix (wHTH) protein